MRYATVRICLGVVCMAVQLSAARAESQCFGSVSKGRIEGSVKLPTEGPNFSSYSSLAATLGRTFVHRKVAAVMADSYATLNRQLPDKHYVYGETGWSAGGSFKPHRTHQNGLSVDFFVPVTDGEGRSGPIPTKALERFGYDIEFDAKGRYAEYSIDFAAMAAHVRQLHIAAKAHGIGITQVIFDPPLLPKLLATPDGPYLRQHIRFMRRPAWVRHDEHYHVDFAVRCKPL